MLAEFLQKQKSRKNSAMLDMENEQEHQNQSNTFQQDYSTK